MSRESEIVRNLAREVTGYTTDDLAKVRKAIVDAGTQPVPARIASASGKPLILRPAPLGELMAIEAEILAELQATKGQPVAQVTMLDRLKGWVSLVLRRSDAQ